MQLTLALGSGLGSAAAPASRLTEGTTVHHHARLSACLLLSALIAVGCGGAGTPSGVPQGGHWTFPLVGPLEGGAPIAPAHVHGKGPYLFAIDPDAGISAIDQQVAEDAGLTTSRGPTLLDEAGTEQMRAYAELVDLQLGTLLVDRRIVMLVPSGFYDTEVRRVNG